MFSSNSSVLMCMFCLFKVLSNYYCSFYYYLFFFFLRGGATRSYLPHPPFVMRKMTLSSWISWPWLHSWVEQTWTASPPDSQTIVSFIPQPCQTERNRCPVAKPKELFIQEIIIRYIIILYASYHFRHGKLNTITVPVPKGAGEVSRVNWWLGPRKEVCKARVNGCWELGSSPGRAGSWVECWWVGVAGPEGTEVVIMCRSMYWKWSVVLFKNSQDYDLSHKSDLGV